MTMHGSTMDSSSGFSVYAAVEDVPISLDLPVTISLKTTAKPQLHPTLGHVILGQTFDTKFESQLLERYKRERLEEEESIRQRQEQLKARREKRTDVIQVGSNDENERPNSNALNKASPYSNTDTNTATRPAIDYLEFEQGLPPPDPFSIPTSIADDIRELRNVIQPELPSPNLPVGSTSVKPQSPVQQPQQNQIQSPPVVPMPEPFQPTTQAMAYQQYTYQLQQHGPHYSPQTTHVPPPIPPKLPRQDTTGSNASISSPSIGYSASDATKNNSNNTVYDELTAKLLSLDFELSEKEVEAVVRVSKGNESKAMTFATWIKKLRSKHKLEDIETCIVENILNNTNTTPDNTVIEEWIKTYKQLREMGFDKQKVVDVMKRTGNKLEEGLEELMK